VPAEQFPQALAPAPENMPAAQIPHNKPTLGVKVPAGQFVQLADEGLED